VLRLVNVTAARAGRCRVIVSNNWGMVTSQVATMTVTVTSAAKRNGFDLDGDGKAELFVQHLNGTLGVWYLNGALFKKGAYVNPPSMSADWSLVGAGDFGGDNKLDLLFESQQHDLGVWFMEGLNRTGASYLTPHDITASWEMALALTGNDSVLLTITDPPPRGNGSL
jgi:hypothetical protein